jgi:hypothetical protein
MAAAFMVQRVRFLSKIFAGIFFLIVACGPEQGIPLVDATDPSFATVNGVVLRNGKRFTGRTFDLFPSSTDIMGISEYSHGVEHGKWLKMYRNGKCREVRNFYNGKKTDLMTGWWENGRKRIEYHFLNDEYEGVCREWNEEGKLVREMNYVKGHEEGAQKVFYENGKVRSNYVVVKGRRYGLLGTKNCVNASDRVFEN